MTREQIQEVRATPLFAEVDDAHLDCLSLGEIIETSPGTVIANEGDRCGFFQVLLAGEVRIIRNYERQSILMAVQEPGDHIGEVMLLLDIPWLSTVRVLKPSR